MRKLVAGLGCILLLGLSWRASASNLEEKGAMKLMPFDLSEVRLLDGRCKSAQETNLRYLLSLAPERLLRSFRINAGLEAPGKPLGGWEIPNSDIRGHFVGHYLSACALMYASTGDDRILERGRLMVAELAIVQEKLGNGYLAAFPESFFDRIEALRQIPPATYYTIHKMMAGLYDQYAMCGNGQALDVLKGMAGYFGKRVEKFSHEELNRILDHVEEGGICESLWNLFGVTGAPADRAVAEKYEKSSFLDPLAAGVDNLAGRHGNTHIPLVVGAMRRYELTGESRYAYLSEFFWDRVVTARSFASGGSTNSEVWGEPFKLAAGLSTTNHETCKTYNMLRLARHLLCATADPKYFEFYERAFFNGILGTQEPESGAFEYYVPQATGYQRVFGTMDTAFWCCTGTGVESYSKLGDSIYFHNADTVYVSLFVPSRVTWKEKKLEIEQRTAFPAEEGTTLLVNPETPCNFSVAVRVPSWAGLDCWVTVNGAPVVADVHPGSFLTITREWRKGDEVKVSLPMALRAWPMPDDPNLVALMYGPVVLAGITSPADDLQPILSGDPNCPQPAAEQAKRAYYFVSDSVNDLSWLKPMKGQPLHFTAGEGQPFSMTFKPFNEVVGERYGVYWPVIPAGCDRQAALDKENQALEVLRAAASAADSADVAARVDGLLAAYRPLAEDGALKAYRERLAIAVAKAVRRAGRAEDAAAMVAPYSQPFVNRALAPALREIIQPEASTFERTVPLVIVSDYGDGAARTDQTDGRPSVSSDVAKSRSFVYFALPNDAPFRGLGVAVEMTIQYHVAEGAKPALVVEYDAVDSAGGAYTKGQTGALAAEPGWHEAIVQCPAAQFSGRQNYGADFRVSTSGEGDVCLGGLTVKASGDGIKELEKPFDTDAADAIDRVVPGDEAAEKAHNLQGEGTQAGPFMTHAWRHAVEWWSWDLKVDAKRPMALACVYWGSDVNRQFDVLVNDRKIATQELTGTSPGRFVRVVYPIPEELTRGKEAVTVTFRKTANLAGGVFQCSTIARSGGE